MAGAGFFGIPAWIAVLAALVLIAFTTVFRQCWRWEHMTLALALFNLVFISMERC